MGWAELLVPDGEGARRSQLAVCPDCVRGLRLTIGEPVRVALFVGGPTESLKWGLRWRGTDGIGTAAILRDVAAHLDAVEAEPDSPFDYTAFDA